MMEACQRCAALIYEPGASVLNPSSLRGRLSFRVIPGYPVLRVVRCVSFQFLVFSFQYSVLITRYWALRTQLSTRRAVPVAPRLPTYAPPRGFCATGADRAGRHKLLTAINLRNGTGPVHAG